MKKLILSLVTTSLLIFTLNTYATGDGIQHGTSYKFPNKQSSGFEAKGDFWGGSNGEANAAGAGQDLESKTFSAGTSEGNFGSTFNGKKLNMEGNVNVSQEAGAFNSAQGGDHAGSYTSSEISGGAGMDGMGRVWGGKSQPHNQHNQDGHHHHNHNHHGNNDNHGNNHDNDYKD